MEPERHAERLALKRLLRTQLTAVNQQFVHILALRGWGETEAAERIAAIDSVDFPVAMKIMGHLVAVGEPLGLGCADFAPGDTLPEICAAELEIERRMADRLSIDLSEDHPARAWLDDARRVRENYVGWLRERAARSPGANGRTEAPDTPLHSLFAHLVALVEQPMAHAFVHWRRGQPGDADIAWATSGVAMTKAGALVRAMARTGATPKASASAEISIGETPEAAIRKDRDLAARCALAAAGAVEATTDQLARHCRDIEAFARRVAEHRNGAHPSMTAAAPCFRSFEATLDRHVR